MANTPLSRRKRDRMPQSVLRGSILREYGSQRNAVDSLEPYIDSSAPASDREVQRAWALNTATGAACTTVKIPGLAASAGDSRTFCAWIKIDTHTGAHNGVVGLAWDGDGSDQQYHCISIISGGDLVFLRRLDGSSNVVNSGYTVSTDTWYHVAVSISGTTGYAFYVNGEQVADITAPAQAVPTNVNTFITAAARVGTYTYDGRMKGARYYKHALAAHEVRDLYAGTEIPGWEVRWDLNHRNGKYVLCSSGDYAKSGTITGSWSWYDAVDSPPKSDCGNREGYGLGRVLTANNGRLRWDNGTLPEFEMSKVRLCWYQPVEITSASSPLSLFAFNTTNGAVTLRTGSSTGLAENEVLTFNGSTGSRTYITDSLSVGFHTLEIVNESGNDWEFYLDGVQQSVLRHSSSAERTVNQLWLGPSSNGSDAQTGIVFAEAKIWDDSDDLVFDLDVESSEPYDKISGMAPDSIINCEPYIIPLKSADTSLDVFDRPALYTGNAFPIRPMKRDSYGVNFTSGVRLESPVMPELLATFPTVIEMRVFVPSGSGTIVIGANTHSGNNSTCFSPHIRVDRTNNQLNWYGCRSSPFTHWDINDRFYDRWMTLKFELGTALSSNTAHLTIDGGERMRSNDQEVSPGDWGYTRDTYWAFGDSLNSFQMAWVKVSDDESTLFHWVFTTGAGPYAIDISTDDEGNPQKRHGIWVNATTGTEGSGTYSARTDYHHNPLHGNSRYNVLTRNSGSGWGTSGANSIESVTGDFVLRVRPLSHGHYFMVGMTSDPDVGNDFTSIDHAVYFSDTSINMWENGVSQGGTTNFDPLSNIEIRRVGGAVTVWVDDAMVYTFTNGAENELWVDAAMNSSNSVTGLVRLNDRPVTWENQTLVDENVHRIPAIPGTMIDGLGDVVTHPPAEDGGGNNASEVIFDRYNIAEGDNPCPASQFAANFAAIDSDDDPADLQTTSPANTQFGRRRSDYADDRMIGFTEAPEGEQLTAVQNYVES